MAEFLLYIQLLRLDLRVLLCLHQKPPAGQPGLSAASDAPPLRHRRRDDALGVPPSPRQHSGRLPGRHHSRQHSGICHRIRHGAAFQDEILGLQPSALPDQRLRQPGILPDLGTSDHSADGMGAPAHLGLRPGPVSLDRISGAGGSHRRVCAGRGAVHQRGAGSGPRAGGHDPHEGGSRGTAAAAGAFKGGNVSESKRTQRKCCPAGRRCGSPG